MPVFIAFRELMGALRGRLLLLVKSGCFVSFHRIFPPADGETQLHIDGGRRSLIQKGGRIPQKAAAEKVKNRRNARIPPRDGQASFQSSLRYEIKS
jgi:hypothetical protein